VATTLRTLPTAPPVRKVIRATYREYLVEGQWQRRSRAERHVWKGAPSVTVHRIETVYREPIGTRGERSRVTFHVTGERRAEYLRDALPTVTVRADGNGTMLAIWYY
jgi:hypothetical protein